MKKPKHEYQGSLDGLCGIYAVVNAFSLCIRLDRSDKDKILRTCCESISKRCWPKALWDGTDIDEISKMIKKCKGEIKLLGNISISHPFESDKWKSETNREYHAELGRIFANTSAVCCIVRLVQPQDGGHWIVIDRDGGRIRFYDSDREDHSSRKNLSSIYFGARKRNESQRKFDPVEIILFSNLQSEE